MLRYKFKFFFETLQASGKTLAHISKETKIDRMTLHRLRKAFGPSGYNATLSVVEKICDVYQVNPEALIAYEVPATPTGPTFEPYENDENIKNKHNSEYLVDLDQISALCSNLEGYALRRQHREILGTHNLSKLLFKMRDTKHLFKIEEIYAIESLAAKAEFGVFPRKDEDKKSGRPHQDPEMRFAWELSCIYKHKQGTHKGDTDWEKVVEMIGFFSEKHPFLKALTRDSEVLRKNVRNFKRRYKYKDEDSHLWKNKRRQSQYIERLSQALNPSKKNKRKKL